MFLAERAQELNTSIHAKARADLIAVPDDFIPVAVGLLHARNSSGSPAVAAISELAKRDLIAAEQPR